MDTFADDDDKLHPHALSHIQHMTEDAFVPPSLVPIHPNGEKNTKYFAQSVFGTYVHNCDREFDDGARLEYKFISYITEQNCRRNLVFSVFFVLVGFLFRGLLGVGGSNDNESDKRFFLVAGAIAVICPVCQTLILIVLHRRKASLRETTDIEITQKNSYVLYHKSLYPLYRLFEVSCVYIMFIMLIVIGLQVNINHVRCEIFYRHDPETKTCIMHFDGYLILFFGYGVVMGLPRLWFNIGAIVTSVIVTFVTRSSFGVQDTLVQTISEQCYHVIGAVCFCLVKYFDEQNYRKHFETRVVNDAQRMTLEHHLANMNDFIVSVTPKCIRQRLNSNTRVLMIDKSPTSVVILTDVYDCAAFMVSKLIVDSASMISNVQTANRYLANHLKLNFIREVGDLCIVTGNHFEFTSPSDGEVKKEEETTPSSSLLETMVNAITYCKAIHSINAPVKLRSSIAIGELVGMPLGHACVRYDVYGAALDEARDLLSACPKSKVNASRRVWDEFENELKAQLNDSTLHPQSDEPISLNSFKGTVKESSSSTPTVSNSESFTSPPTLVTLNPSASLLSSVVSSTAVSNPLSNNVSISDSHTPPPHDKSELPSIGWISQTITNKAADAVDTETYSNSLEINKNTCCNVCCLAFSSPHMEDAFLQYEADNYHILFIIVNVFFILSGFLIIISASVERSSDLIDGHLELCIGLFLVLVSICIHFTVACLKVKYSSLLNIHHSVAFVLANLVLMAGTGLTRPATVGLVVAYLLTIQQFFIIYAGLPKHVTWMVQLLYFAAWILFTLAYKPIFPGGVVFIYPLTTILTALYGFDKRQTARKVFRVFMFSEHALKQLQVSEDVRSSILKTLVPHQLLFSITNEQLRGVKGDNKMRAWTQDDICFIYFKFSNVELSTFKSPEQLQSHADATIGALEDAVRCAPNQTLDVIEVFGGTVTVAGPIVENGKKCNPLHETLQDVLYVLHFMLQKKKNDTCTTGGIHFTAAVTIDVGANLLTMGEYPSYSLLGPVATKCEGMALAAPYEVVVATERFIQQVEQLKVEAVHMPIPELDNTVGNVESPPSLLIEYFDIGQSERWRVKGAGVMRVHSIKLPSIGERRESTNCSTVQSVSTTLDESGFASLVNAQ